METKQTKFSIIIPVYNVSRYLNQCLESVVKQTIKDLEIICVNDGSTDNSLDILREWSRLDRRIRIIDKINGGLSSARNVGLDLANGDYILFVDSDDELTPITCERLYSEILEEKPDVIVFGTSIFPWIHSENQTWLYSTLDLRQINYRGNCIDALFNEKVSKPFVWNKCYKREMLEANNMRFDEELKYGEDMAFLFDLFSNIQSASFIPDKLYRYRCERPKSLMANARANKIYKLNYHMLIFSKITENWAYKGCLNDYVDEYCDWAVRYLFDEFEEIKNDSDFKEEYIERFFYVIDKYKIGITNKIKYRWSYKYIQWLRKL